MIYVFYDNNNNNNGKPGSRKQVIKDQEIKRIHEMMTRGHARLNDNSLARKQSRSSSIRNTMSLSNELLRGRL